MSNGTLASLDECLRQDCGLLVDDVALLRDQAHTNAIIIEPDSCAVEECEEQYVLRPGEWSACSAECWADNAPTPTRTREMGCYRLRGAGNYRFVSMDFCDAMAEVGANVPKNESAPCNQFSCERTPCQVRLCQPTCVFPV